MFAHAEPQARDRVEHLAIAVRARELGQADEIPQQLVRLAGRDVRGVGAGDELGQQRKIGVVVGVFEHQRRQIEPARFARRGVQFHRGVEQHRRRQAVMIAEIADIDAAVAQRGEAQVADMARRVEIARVAERAMRLDQAEHEIRVHPDVPRAHARRAVPRVASAVAAA